ncbi:MAG: ATP-dependent helicase [Chloroflexota bacterium]|jgi:DNA helicase-2/ATP-dependent DNA helicase PcrA
MSEFIPNEGQRAALEAELPVLVLAGAGTGKTTVLTHRIANLVANEEARPDQILALTFADKAAAEMSDRLARLLDEKGMGDAGREVRCSTFHSFGVEMIRDYAPLLGMESDCRVITTPESWLLLTRIIDDMDFEAIELPLDGLGSVIDGMLTFFSRAKDHLVDLERLQSWLRDNGRRDDLSEIAQEHLRKRVAELKDVAAVYEKYEQAKREKSYLDYGDLLSLPVRLLEMDLVRQSYHDRYRYIFVDEYQDTNYAQKELLMRLLPPGAPVFVIGDDDQSIYGWRGAVLQNILRFGDEPPIEAAGLTPVKLEENRRSGSRVLDVANRIIKGIDKPEEYRKSLVPMQDNPITATVGHYVAASDQSEAAWIARTIAEIRSAGRAIDPTGSKEDYGVFAVLCRKRSLFPAIAQALEDACIPYELIGGTGFFGRWEIRDILSYLRVLSDPADNVALARVLQSRAWKISDRDLFHLSKWARLQTKQRESHESPGQSQPDAGDARDGESPSHPELEGVEDEELLGFRLYDAVAHYKEVQGLGDEARARLAEIDKLLDRLFKATHRLSLAELVEMVIEEAGYRRELSARRGLEGNVDVHLALLNLGKLVELARQLQENEGSLDTFVEYVQYALESGGEESEVRPVDEKSNTVKVMSVHQAKGLEFPIVFLPGLAEGIFPSTKTDNPDHWSQLPEELRGDRDDYPAMDLAGIETEKDLKEAVEERRKALAKRGEQEERRLFYVAVTRAQSALYLSRAQWYFSNVKPKKPSSYWVEVVGEEGEESGLSTPLGEELAPDCWAKPVDGRAQDRSSATLSSGLARLLLRPDEMASFIGEVAAEAPSLWKQKKAEIDRQVEYLAKPLSFQISAPPLAISCTGLIQYCECPRLYRYLNVDKLPTRPAPWIAVGTEVHRLIEEMTSQPDGRRIAAEDEDREPDLDEEILLRRGDEQIQVQNAIANFERSRFSRRPATRIEESFTLPIGGHLVRGRIDRLDRLPDDSWEIVDYKVSRFYGEALHRQRLQMGLYSLAAWRLWDIDPARLSCHLLYLIDGHEETLQHTAEELEALERWVAEKLRELGEGRFPRAENGEVCRGCGYGHLC